MNSTIIKKGYKNSEVGVIPEEWEAIELEKLLTFKNGINASKKQYGIGYKFINVLDITLIVNIILSYSASEISKKNGKRSKVLEYFSQFTNSSPTYLFLKKGLLCND